MELHSPAFKQGTTIPRKYARKGENLSPPLRWTGAPREAKSFALVVEDPDAPSGMFRHWGVHGISADMNELPEGAGRGDERIGAEQVLNDFGDKYYDGPEPPRGSGAHHYRFRLAALDTEKLGLPANAKVEDLWRAAQPHILDEAHLVGMFEQR